MILLSKISQLALGPTQPAISTVPGVNRPGYKVNHSYLLLRLRMSGGIPLLPLYAFVVSAGKTSHLHDSIPTIKNLVEDRNLIFTYGAQNKNILTLVVYHPVQELSDSVIIVIVNNHMCL
jgi:hypothetical protein